MKKEDFEKFLIKRLSDNYMYHITELYSKDSTESFWGLEKIISERNICLVFLNKDNINNVEEQKYDEFIKIIILEDEDVRTPFTVRDEDINNVIILDKEKNSIVYCPEILNEVGGQIYSILNYRSEVKERKNEKSFITTLLIGINVLLYIVTAFLSGNVFDSDIRVLVFLGAKVNELIRQGEYYRLFTAMFLHGGLMHLVLNMYALHALGPLVEKIYGKVKYLIIYFVSGMISSIFSYLFSSGVSIGASGAIFGLLGASLIFGIKMRDKVGKGMVRNIIYVIGINVFIGVAMPNIDNFGHLGGLIGGSIISLVLWRDNMFN
ncbi:rhomboid family intramembrane serine protease [Clostridium sp. MB40-C1]|uniref:rhomboid family intramembrane serine protease n=1 Tax=Clostridium sp. MB40-C1 TaxID=3070996 RepID=UPI0027DFA73B|nr:rhomboid family intramembrane serine protease [Clostridium sp. MB40-C1]WMJ80799.1 rhomboid family intramembrane serine protease [Clostridium sp. MB40-C1]